MNDNQEESVQMNQSVSSIEYPRTGKRGVPQQFPRRLYHMLEMESTKEEGPKLIAWSPSGTAFKIEDPVQFSSLILPKYFKTTMFSSFQRNMNLYGFTKVRRGPEADMYAHPDFIRGKPENMYKLKKLNMSSRRKAGLTFGGGISSMNPSQQVPPASGAGTNMIAGTMYDPRSIPRDQAHFMYPMYHPYPPPSFRPPPYGSYPPAFPPMFTSPSNSQGQNIPPGHRNYPSNLLPYAFGPNGVPNAPITQNKLTREDSMSTSAPASVTVEDSIEVGSSVSNCTAIPGNDETSESKKDSDQTEETDNVSEPFDGISSSIKKVESAGESSGESSKMNSLLTLAMTCLKDEK